MMIFPRPSIMTYSAIVLVILVQSTTAAPTSHPCISEIHCDMDNHTDPLCGFTATNWERGTSLLNGPQTDASNKGHFVYLAQSSNGHSHQVATLTSPHFCRDQTVCVSAMYWHSGDTHHHLTVHVAGDHATVQPTTEGAWTGINMTFHVKRHGTVSFHGRLAPNVTQALDDINITKGKCSMSSTKTSTIYGRTNLSLTTKRKTNDHNRSTPKTITNKQATHKSTTPKTTTPKPHTHKTTKAKPTIHNATKPKQNNYKQTAPNPTTRKSLAEDFLPRGFVRADVENKGERHILLATDQQLSMLSRSRQWFVDGTFKIVRAPFYQLLSVHAFIAYQKDDAVHKFVRKLMALPFLPSEHIPRMFAKIADRAPMDERQGWGASSGYL
ncbi:uncharacterized protein LOC124254697 [Haliotis rubra]|uniref:uncharacterized protein LOC124254697 n=1 Tax=Haliotis rubra TaxID=36100 RepID=UPI001EE5AFDA|nr:uncharacterized protein LOC124254697 [Haliotis rubra]